MRLTHVLQSPATCQLANIPMTRRCSRAQEDISSDSSKRFVPKTASAHFDIAKQAQNTVEKLPQRFHLSAEVSQWQDIAVYPFIAVQVGSFVRFNDVLAKVQLEIFLLSAVANGISLGMPNKSANKPDANSEAVRIRHILAYTQR